MNISEFKELGEVCSTPIQFLVMIFALLALIYNHLSTRRMVRREIYQRLELASIDLFRFEMKHSDKTWRLYDPKCDLTKMSGQEYHEMANHVTQILNLFEMSVELHSRKILDAKIFSTWVKWFFEIGMLNNFQMIWKDIKLHYTADLRKILDAAADSGRDWEKFVTVFDPEIIRYLRQDEQT